MSDTPETDEQINGKPCTSFYVCAGDTLRDTLVPSEFARKLERERDEARRGIRLMAQNAEVWKERADQARRELDIQLESIHFHMERVPVREHPLRADDAPLSGEEHEKSDTPETRKVFDWFYSRNADRVSSFIGINRVQVRMEDLERERDEAREALRVLFKDYKELADSGDAGFWELEDQEAAQPALRILQQMEAAK